MKKIPWYLSWKGLLGQKPRAIYFTTRFGIHTFGMQYPIDVVILDRKNSIWKMKENLLPNRIFFWNPFYNKVLELPQGTIKRMRLHIGGGIALGNTKGKMRLNFKPITIYGMSRKMYNRIYAKNSSWSTRR